MGTISCFYEINDPLSSVLGYNCVEIGGIFMCIPVYKSDFSKKPSFSNRLKSWLKMLPAHRRKTR